MTLHGFEMLTEPHGPERGTEVAEGELSSKSHDWDQRKNTSLKTNIFLGKNALLSSRLAKPGPFHSGLVRLQGNALGLGQLWKGSALVGTEPKSISSSAPRSPERMSQLQGLGGVGCS